MEQSLTSLFQIGIHRITDDVTRVPPPVKIQQAVQEMLDTEDEESDDESGNEDEMPTLNPCMHYAATEFFDCMEEEFSDALCDIEITDEEVFGDPGELFSKLVEVEEVSDELPNNQQADENCAHEDNDNDNDEELYHFDAMDTELELPGEVKVFHLNLDHRRCQGENRMLHERRRC